MAMIGRSTNCMSLRSLRVASMPPTRRMRTSTRTTSGWNTRAASTIVSPSPITSTAWPRPSSMERITSWLTSSSSATSTRSAAMLGPLFDVDSVGSSSTVAFTSGRRTQNVEPAPTRLSTSSVPPMACTSRREIDRPRPKPRSTGDSSGSTNGEKMASRRSRAMPTPVSDTHSTNVSPRARTLRDTVPDSVNFTALATKLIST